MLIPNTLRTDEVGFRMTQPSVSALLAYGLEQQAKSGAVHERDAGEVQQDLTVEGAASRRAVSRIGAVAIAS